MKAASGRAPFMRASSVRVASLWGGPLCENHLRGGRFQGFTFMKAVPGRASFMRSSFVIATFVRVISV